MPQFPQDLQLMYGTAWKEDATANLTYLALNAGFRAIDTANQRKHYFEEGVGEGIKKFLEQTGSTRDALFLQTKYTYERGQDHRLPYDPRASFSEQVKQSFASSLEHLGTDHIDSYVLHGPYRAEGVFEEDQETWRAFESLHSQGKVKHLGVSNVSPLHLSQLLDFAEVKPTFVQNRCFARVGWDQPIREICKEHGLIYQGFSLLTANSAELSHPSVAEMAHQHGKTIPQLVFQFSRQLGMLPLTGTTSEQHMKQDLKIGDFELTPAQVNNLESIALS
jgi:diketogulonate reductase-like aldo/keto reductase